MNPITIIASHIFHEKRIRYLQLCLESVLPQSPVYISVSFDTKELEIATEALLQTYSPKVLQYKKREGKTSQFKHYQLATRELVTEDYDWYFFCDDDDTYDPDRVKLFGQVIEAQKHDPTFSGLYESSVGQAHQQYRYEYWAYCIRPELLRRFFAHITHHDASADASASASDNALNNRCCDILLVEYLRRLNPLTNAFARLDIPEKTSLYHYRKLENDESVTETILKSHRFLWTPSPTSIGDVRFADYIVAWNDYLHENLHYYLHDMFLRTVVGCDLEYILRTEFQGDYIYLEFVDPIHKERMIAQYEATRALCLRLYDVYELAAK
jgi:glycosyltransferase involved in cell wall biosynthesis